MKCQICKERTASFHFTEVINEQVTEISLCAQCAKEKGFIPAMQKAHSALSHFIGSLSELDSPTEIESHLRCEQCGLEFQEFRKIGRLGCSHCYKAFEEQIESLLHRIHGSARHMGKFPLIWGAKIEKDRRIAALREELDKAIKKENFEKAAEIRDEIRRLEKKDFSRR
jgi:protein arginine kinase activator